MKFLTLSLLALISTSAFASKYKLGYHNCQINYSSLTQEEINGSFSPENSLGECISRAQKELDENKHVKKAIIKYDGAPEKDAKVILFNN